MKHFLLIEIFLPLILAVDRCPIYRESGWKLVRRTTDNSFAATDNLDGTDVYGPEHENVFGWFDLSLSFLTNLRLKFIVLPVNIYIFQRFDQTIKRRVVFNRLYWY